MLACHSLELFILKKGDRRDVMTGRPQEQRTGCKDYSSLYTHNTESGLNHLFNKVVHSTVLIPGINSLIPIKTTT